MVTGTPRGLVRAGLVLTDSDSAATPIAPQSCVAHEAGHPSDELLDLVVPLLELIEELRSTQPVLDRLPPETYAVSVSLRGHGDSDKPGSGYSVNFAADVILFIDALGIERAVLAGHSGSCLVARRVLSIGFGQIKAPTLLVWGDADPIVSRATQDHLVRSIPDAALTVYRGVGHTPRWEEPLRFSRDLATFDRRQARRQV